MAVHDAFEGAGLNSNRACDFLISNQPPVTESDCLRLEMIARQVELSPDSRGDHLLKLCEMARLLAPD